jgi:D-glycero-D-manno-heptose 1,7-bisphosphate phosphatase
MVILICGAPGSGKSSLTKKFLSAEVVVLNRDTEGGTIANLLPKLEQCLKDQDDVILDNTFPTIESRKPFIELCKKYNTKISCYLMDTSTEDATFNVVQRAIGILGKFPTPEEIKKAKHPNIFPPTVLFRYRKEFQKPTVEEGFSKVNIIKFVRKDNLEFTNKALILDYDSTLRECINGNGKYPISKEQINILPNRKNVIQSYKDKGYILLGVSNQSGIAKGELSLETAKELFDHTNQLLGFDIDYRFCPHQSAPISCYCRKPQVGAFVDLMLKYKLNRSECLFVGDFTTDATFAKRCGIQYVDQSEFFK